MSVFISHISEEAPLAIVLKNWIQDTFLGEYAVFVSSDRDDIAAGSKWLKKITTALDSAKVYIVLCSPASIKRPWIHFESGCGWTKDVPIIPVCHSGLTKSSLPSPLSHFQAIDIKDEKFAEDLLKALAKHLRVSRIPRIDYEAFNTAISEALEETVRVAEPVMEHSHPDEHEPHEDLSTANQDYDEEDMISILTSWMGNRPSSDNRKVIFFSNVDTELNLKPDTSKKYIEVAARHYNYVVLRKGQKTILFGDAPPGAPRSVQRSF